MPIKPENKKLYPKNWQEIRQAILKRANNKCEFCGVENRKLGFRMDGMFIEIDENKAPHLEAMFKCKFFRIVLTIAHLDHNPQNNNPDNLRALCQRCHNNYDKEHRKETRMKTKKASSK